MIIKRSVNVFLIGILALLVDIQCYYIPVVHLDCNEVPVEICKNEFRYEFEEGFRYNVIELAKNLTSHTNEHIQMILEDLPESEELKQKQLNEILKYYEIYIETIIAMQNHTTELLAIATNGPNLGKYNLPELLTTDKYSYTDLEMKNLQTVELFIDNIRVIWSNLYAGIRIKDWQAYPQYEQINNTAKILGNLKGLGKIELFQSFLKSVFTFFGYIN